jgi:hypothetical protein
MRRGRQLGVLVAHAVERARLLSPLGLELLSALVEDHASRLGAPLHLCGHCFRSRVQQRLPGDIVEGQDIEPIEPSKHLGEKLLPRRSFSRDGRLQCLAGVAHALIGVLEPLAGALGLVFGPLHEPGMLRERAHGPVAVGEDALQRAAGGV